MKITATHVIPDDASGEDLLYIRGAGISDPENDPSSVWDEENCQWTYVISVKASEDEKPYRDALAAHGLTVIGEDSVTGDWFLNQEGAL